MSFVDQIRSLIGTPPEDLQALEYVVSAILLVFVLHSCFKLVGSIFHISGR